MKVYLDSIGCRLNQSEIETLARQLLAQGHELVSDPAVADKVVINTCAVTGEAAKDARKMTRRIHRGNPGAEILLTGCYATIAPDELGIVNGAGRIVPNQDKDDLLQIIDPRASHPVAIYDREPILRHLLTGSMGNTRAFVKVQDGCDNRCTFCVTTIARGQGQSRRLGDVVAEVQALAGAGYQEAVLTGVHLGSYGRDLGNGSDLGGLLKAILEHTDIGRLRISSLEPWDVAPGFFELWADSRLLPHLHLPLQSGSNRILRRMARRTTREAFRDLVGQARAHIPDVNLSTDLIAGFPGETEADFAETLAFVREMAFARLHVFTYSRRPGTAAGAMDGQVPGALKKERAKRLLALGRELSLAFHSAYMGRTRPVLWESAVGADTHGLKWIGYTDNYIRVTASGGEESFNQVTPTRLTSPRADGMLGEILG
ncbi:MAG: tRNA (N(6)-L-threonylcarbamoyladenosine(37)-C(2))-methylthiotransferase MtaB [Chloroflexota bacterium]|jgi:threonylcarbamoyladenosine tRNA methylthiotransferase MtaB